MTATQRLQVEGAAHAAQLAAAPHGWGLPDHVADAVAAAVLAHRDTTVTVDATIHRSAWEIPEARDHILRDLRRELLEQLDQRGALPVERPQETTRTYREREGVAVPAHADWDVLEVRLAVGARIPAGAEPAAAEDETGGNTKI